MIRQQDQRQEEGAPQNDVPEPLLGEIEPARPAHFAPRVIYRQTNDARQPVQIFTLIAGNRNPMPELKKWDPSYFFFANPANTPLDYQLCATVLNMAIPCTFENLRYMTLHCWNRGLTPQQALLYLEAIMERGIPMFGMNTDDVEFWFRRFRRGNEDLAVNKSKVELEQEEKGWLALRLLQPFDWFGYYSSSYVNETVITRNEKDLEKEEARILEDLTPTNMVPLEPFVGFDGGPLEYQPYEANRFDYYRAWLRYEKTMPHTKLHRRYAISLAFQHRYTVKRARNFLWGLWGVPADERYPVETEEIEFWYRRFRRGNFREMDLELRKRIEELQLEEQGWLALGLLQHFDWLGYYYLSYENGSEIRRYNETARNNSRLVFQVLKGVALPQDRNAPDSYIRRFLRRLPNAEPNRINFARANRFIPINNNN